MTPYSVENKIRSKGQDLQFWFMFEALPLTNDRDHQTIGPT